MKIKWAKPSLLILSFYQAFLLDKQPRSRRPLTPTLRIRGLPVALVKAKSCQPSFHFFATAKSPPHLWRRTRSSIIFVSPSSRSWSKSCSSKFLLYDRNAPSAIAKNTCTSSSNCCPIIPISLNTYCNLVITLEMLVQMPNTESPSNIQFFQLQNLRTTNLLRKRLFTLEPPEPTPNHSTKSEYP